MKKLFFIFALLLVVGVASNALATGIPGTTDPKNYPVVWTEQVYNGSGDTIVSGYIVRWDFDASDSGVGSYYDDMCPWVETVDAAGSVWTAGVLPIGYDIVNGGVGSMIIRGPAVVKMTAAAQCTVNTIAEATATGTASDHDGAATDEGTIGVCIKASAAGNDVGGDIYADSALIYVNPVQYDKD